MIYGGSIIHAHLTQLHKFLNTREKGAFFTNVEYRDERDPGLPAFDWIGFDDAQLTQDKTLQKSIAAKYVLALSTFDLDFILFVRKRC